MTPSPAAERGRLLAACVEVVGEVGYGSAGLDAILARAGLDMPAFERHFEDREALFLAAWGESQQHFLAAATSAFGEGEAWRDSMRALGAASLRFLREHPHEARVVAEGRNAGEPVRSRFEATFEAIVDLVDRGRQELEDPGSLTRATAEGLVGAVYERVTREVVLGTPFEEMEALLPDLMFLIVRPYLGIEAATEELARAAA